jgi:hypothetical protein
VREGSETSASTASHSTVFLRKDAQEALDELNGVEESEEEEEGDWF